MTAISPIAFDAAAIRTHIEMIHNLAAGCDGVIPLCVFGENPDSGRKTAIVLHFRVGDVDGMTAAALAYETHPDANVYAPLAVMRRDLPHNEKGREIDVTAVLGAVIDDDADAGRRARLPVEPNYSIQSSALNRQHFILFNRALTPREAKPIAEAFYCACGGDHGTKDLSHVWRIAGTANWPNKKKVCERNRPRDPQPVLAATPWDGNLHDIEHIRVVLAPHMKCGAKTDGRAQDDAPGDIAAIMARLGAGVRKLIAAPPMAGEDRSKTLASVITSMIRAGLSDPEIQAVIEAHPNGVGAKFIGRPDLGREIERLREKFSRDGKQYEVALVRAADVVQEPVQWIWENRLARGKLTLIGGDPGVGKSQVVLAVIARITTGRIWPDGGLAPLGNCIILSAEDAASDTICPRLEAAGADLSRVHILQAIREQAGRKRSFNLQSDLDALAAAIRGIGGATLVMIDPITAYMGETDSHKTADVRAVLEAVDRFSAANGIAIAAITHPPKAAQTKAINAFTGSLAYVAAARLAFVAVEERDKDDGSPTGRVLLLSVKNNIGRKADGIAYRIEPAITEAGIATCRIVWDSAPVTMTANEAVGAGDKPRTKSAQQEAEEWLCEYIADQPMPAAKVREAAEAKFISEATLRRAAKALGVVSEKTGFDVGWVWRLPATGLGREAE